MFNARNLNRKQEIEDLPYAFVFSVEGAIVDSSAHQCSTWQKILAENGITQSVQEIETQCFGKSDEIIQRFLGKQLSLDRVEEIAQRQEAVFRDIFRPDLQVLEGLKRFLDEAQAMNIQMAAISDSSLALIDFILTETGLRDYFKSIVGAEDVDRGQPSPDLFLKASLRLGMMPEDLIAFVASDSGLEAAERASVKAFAIQPSPGTIAGTHPNLIQTFSDYGTLRPTLAYDYSLKLSLQL